MKKPKTPRKALLASIKHWEENCAVARLEDAKVLGDSCALCQYFTPDSDDEETERCETPDGQMCPVMERTGHNECGGTPWVDAYRALRNGDLEAFHKAAQAELAFLQSLLPPE